MKNTEHGAAIYSPFVLSIYDLWVLNISNSFFWKCSTKDILLPFFKKNLSKKHLDVGVGTGYYLKNSDLSDHHDITLMDLNENSLAAAKNRLRPFAVKTIHHDIMQTVPDHFHHLYDSISLFYLIHCLPGDLNNKSLIFNNLKKLSPNGVVYGATILGEYIHHNYGGKKLMNIYNKKGIFSNRIDTAEKLKLILEDHFHEVNVEIYGKVALFEARQPIL